ncbi:MAG: SprT family zinc-dependent metalloprotease [Mobilitalea sp.]
MKQIIINDIRIELERKKIKNMYLRILPPEGKVVISAPVRMSEEEITRFVTLKQEWIEKQQEKIEQRHINQELNYLSGEEIYIWGKLFVLDVRLTKGHNKVSFEADNFVLYTKAESTREQRKKIIDYWYKEALKQEIPALFTKWEQIINVKSSDWNIRDMKTRWGTCNIRTKKICLNLQLAKKPPKCLEYVVVHELVHLLEKSHDRVFKAYMDRFLPGWRQIKKELNGQG